MEDPRTTSPHQSDTQGPAKGKDPASEDPGDPNSATEIQMPDQPPTPAHPKQTGLVNRSTSDSHAPKDRAPPSHASEPHEPSPLVPRSSRKLLAAQRTSEGNAWLREGANGKIWVLDTPDRPKEY